MTITAHTHRESPAISIDYWIYRFGYLRHDGTPNLIEVFRTGSESEATGPTPEEVDAIMAWATDPEGLDWALLERLEDWDDPDEQ